MMKLTVVILFFAIGLNAQEPVLKLIDLGKVPAEKILEDEGETVRVRGFVTSTSTNATGINFLDFKDTDFVCVTFGRFVSNFTDGPPAEVYKEKWIEVSGEIQNYRGAPQIRVESPEQVKILAEPPPPPPEPDPSPEMAKEEKKEEVVKKPEPEPEVAPEKAEKGRELEVIDGVPALDWRKYFPE
ncbi:MAG: hypothetical protein P1V20_19835 [Verrucomicrobiales bacterium]|nr:hypothetical protein [Verrucomicrobiales bacterium]